MWTYKLRDAVCLGAVQWRGLRRKSDDALVAFIAGTPMSILLGQHSTRVLEIHTLFVHPRLRGKRLTPLLVQSMILHGINSGFQHAVHTHRQRLPVRARPIATLTYYTRPLRPIRMLRSRRLRTRPDVFETRADAILRFGIDARGPAVRASIRRRCGRQARPRTVARRVEGLELAPDVQCPIEFRNRFMARDVRTYGVFLHSRCAGPLPVCPRRAFDAERHVGMRLPSNASVASIRDTRCAAS